MRCYRVSQYTFLATGRLHCRQQPNLCYVLQGGPGRSERPLAGWWAETAKVSNVHVFACPRQITAEVMDLTCSLPLQKLTRCERSKSWVPPNWLSPPLTFEAWAALPPELEPFFQDAATLTVSPQVNSIFSTVLYKTSSLKTRFEIAEHCESWCRLLTRFWPEGRLHSEQHPCWGCVYATTEVRTFSSSSVTID